MSTVIVRASGDALVSVAQAPDRHLVRAHIPQRQVVLAGVRGRPGKNGEGAGGVTYIQDSAPQGAVENETWYNPVTLQLKVFHNGSFQPVSPDGGHF